MLKLHLLISPILYTLAPYIQLLPWSLHSRVSPIYRAQGQILDHPSCPNPLIFWGCCTGEWPLPLCLIPQLPLFTVLSGFGPSRPSLCSSNEPCCLPRKGMLFSVCSLPLAAVHCTWTHLSELHPSITPWKLALASLCPSGSYATHSHSTEDSLCSCHGTFMDQFLTPLDYNCIEAGAISLFYHHFTPLSIFLKWINSWINKKRIAFLNWVVCISFLFTLFLTYWLFIFMKTNISIFPALRPFLELPLPPKTTYIST